MRTSILLVRDIHADAFDRASLPEDSNPDEDARRLAKYTPRIEPLERNHTDHDRIYFPASGYSVKVVRGKTDKARVIPDEYVKLLAQIDARLEALHKLSKQVKAEAWRRGRPLKVSDLNGEMK